jgi:phosphate uptake regulator
MKELHKDILKMGVMTQEAIFKSTESLKNREKPVAQEVISADSHIDDIENVIDDGAST